MGPFHYISLYRSKLQQRKSFTVTSINRGIIKILWGTKTYKSADRQKCILGAEKEKDDVGTQMFVS